MAKEKFITRTITTTEVIVLGLDTVNCEPFNEAVTITGKFGSDEKSQKALLEAVKAKIDDEGKSGCKNRRFNRNREVV